MVKINRLTYLTFMLNSLIDEGHNIPLKEVKKWCEEKRVIEKLVERFPFKETGFDLSLFDSKMRTELDEIFWDMAVAINERKKMGVENNGLCLIIAYAQEQIQREARSLTD